MIVDLSSIQILSSSPKLPAGTHGEETMLRPGRVPDLHLSADAVLFTGINGGSSMTEWVRRWMRLRCTRESSDEELAKLVMLPPRNGIGKYTMVNLGHWADAEGRSDGKTNAGVKSRAWF